MPIPLLLADPCHTDGGGKGETWAEHGPEGQLRGVLRTDGPDADARSMRDKLHEAH